MEKRQTLFQVLIVKYLFLLSTIGMSSLCTKVQAQVTYDIRLAESYEDNVDSITCFQVQIRSGTSNSWELAGQNYRIYYNTTQATFTSGKSLLGEKYQSFKLVQDVQHVDASDVDGSIPFAADLGFLNYAIDLLDATESSTPVPVDGSWLSTSEICFQGNKSQENLKDFALIWARSGQTDAYATSFVEISTRTGVNELDISLGQNYFDFSSESTATNDLNIQLSAKVYLQGAYEKQTGLMKDNLRAKGYLPLETPYGPAFFNEEVSVKPSSKIETTDAITFEVNDKNAIIDWIFLELRGKQNAGKVIANRSALLQRDGDIVDLDGISPVQFYLPQDSYYLVVRHRNHLGLMSKTPIDFTTPKVTIDFTNPQTLVYGERARKIIDGLAMLWGGNANKDKYLVFQGGGISLPDADKIFFDVFSDETNIYNRYNHIVKGYLDSDLNMDGEVRYQGGNNEVDELLFFNIFSHPANTGLFSNFLIEEQIPSRVE